MVEPVAVLIGLGSISAVSWIVVLSSQTLGVELDSTNRSCRLSHRTSTTSSADPDCKLCGISDHARYLRALKLEATHPEQRNNTEKHAIRVCAGLFFGWAWWFLIPLVVSARFLARTHRTATEVVTVATRSVRPNFLRGKRQKGSGQLALSGNDATRGALSKPSDKGD